MLHKNLYSCNSRFHDLQLWLWLWLWTQKDGRRKINRINYCHHHPCDLSCVNSFMIDVTSLTVHTKYRHSNDKMNCDLNYEKQSPITTTKCVEYLYKFGDVTYNHIPNFMRKIHCFLFIQFNTVTIHVWHSLLHHLNKKLTCGGTSYGVYNFTDWSRCFWFLLASQGRSCSHFAVVVTFATTYKVHGKNENY